MTDFTDAALKRLHRDITKLTDLQASKDARMEAKIKSLQTENNALIRDSIMSTVVIHRLKARVDSFERLARLEELARMN